MITRRYFAKRPWLLPSDRDFAKGTERRRIFWRFKGVNEYTCLYRSYSANLIYKFLETYKYPYLEQKGFACTTELLSKLIFLGPKISEIPIILDYTNKVAESKIKLFSTILMTLKILFINFRKWRYYQYLELGQRLLN